MRRQRRERPNRYQIEIDTATRAEWQAEADATPAPLSVWIRMMVERGREAAYKEQGR